MSNKDNMREIPPGDGQLVILCYECDWYGFTSPDEPCPKCSSMERWYHRTPRIKFCGCRDLCIRCDPYGQIAQARKERMQE